MKMTQALVATAIAVAALPHEGSIAVSAPIPNPKILLAPAEGYPGTEAFLSGGGFRPGQRLSITSSCSGVGSRIRTAGPTVDARGHFVAYSFRLPVARVTVPRHCVVGAAYGSTGAAQAVAAHYVLVPRARVLSPCSVHMCLKVKAFLVRLPSGAQGNIAIQGWAGAWTDVTVTSPRISSRARRIRLDWRGMGAVRMNVAPGVIKGVTARVHVYARLGSVSGSATGRFYIVPGGR